VLTPPSLLLEQLGEPTVLVRLLSLELNSTRTS